MLDAVLRAAVTPAHRGVGAKRSRPANAPEEKPQSKPVAMNRARRLQRVFGVELEGCARCGGKLRIIASNEEPEVIAHIMAQLERGGRAWPSGARHAGSGSFAALY